MSALDPADSLERQNEKLRKINAVLMRRVEQAGDGAGAAYAHFERAALLEEEVRARTRDLHRALDLLNESNAQLAAAKRDAEEAQANLENAIETVAEGFALFNEADVLVMRNSRFCLMAPDVQKQARPGITFDTYVEAVSRSAHLVLPDGVTAEAWAERRRSRHADEHVNFTVQFAGDRWLQVSEHRTARNGTVILQTDVTDMIRLERRERDRLLDDQARVIRATLEHITQGVCIFDRDARLVGSNQRVSELLSLPVTAFVPGAAFGEVFAGLLAGRAGRALLALSEWAGTPGRVPLAFGFRRGSTVLQVSAQRMPDGGFVVSFTDVTAEREALRVISEANETLERRVLERTLELEDAVAAAERANATKSRFVAAAGHDLLQPLSAAKLYLSALEAEVALGADTLPGVVRKAQGALGSVETILGALLDISRLDAGGALGVTDVPLATVLRQLADEFAPLAAQKGLTLRVVPSSAVVRSDATYFRRILQNLIGNAVKYTARGRVLVGARRCGGRVRVEVWDTGPGIPEEQQEAMFREFHRLHGTASASEGMGLGLAIVERACALLEHPLAVRSAVGRGSCFAVTVPLGARARAGEEGRPSTLEGRIALLLDADGEMRRAMTALLESWGLSVLEATAAEDAALLVEEIGLAPDVMLVACPMGGGAEGLRVIREMRGREMIPALLLTADRSRGLAADCAREDVRLAVRPVDTGALRRELALMLSGVVLAAE